MGYFVRMVVRAAPMVGVAAYGAWLLDHGRTGDATRVALLICALFAVDIASIKERG